MQTNGNTSPEGAKNKISLDNIINEFEKQEAAGNSQKNGENAIEKLNEIFKQQEDDLNWLNDFVFGKEDITDDDVSDDEQAVESEIIAENADFTQDMMEDDGEIDGEISEDINRAIADARGRGKRGYRGYRGKRG